MGTTALMPRELLELTTRTAALLDGVVDDFDLVLLRAQAGEALVRDIVFVGAARPRQRARELLEGWLDAIGQLDEPQRQRLREQGLPDTFIEGLLAREDERLEARLADLDSRALRDTATELDRAVVMLEQFIVGSVQDSSHPYR